MRSTLKKTKIEGQKRKKTEQEKEKSKFEKQPQIDFSFAETKIIEMQLKKMMEKVEDVKAKDYLKNLQNQIFYDKNIAIFK